MFTLNPYFQKTADFEVIEMPVGKALGFAVMKGLAGALIDTVNSLSKDATTGEARIPKWAVGPVIALAVGRIPPVRNFLVPAGTETLQIVALVESMEDVALKTKEYAEKAARAVGVLKGPGTIPLVRKAPPLSPGGLAAPTGTVPMRLASPETKNPFAAPTAAPAGRASLTGPGIAEINARLAPVSALNV